MLDGKIYTEYYNYVQDFFSHTNYKPYDYRGRFLDDKIKEHIEERKKSPIYYTPDELAELLIDVVGIKKMATYNNYKADYRHFYDYLIKLGVLKSNICDSILLSHDVILARMTKSVDTTVLTPHDIDVICGRIQYNQILDRAIIRTLYEGISPSGSDIARIKKQDVDFQKGTVWFDGRLHTMSPALSELYSKLGTIDYRYGPNGKKYSIYYHEDELFPTTVKEVTDNYLKKYSVFVKRELYHISEQARMEINAALLHDSGMICTLVRYFGKKEFVRLLESRRGRTDIKILQDALVKFGYIPESERVDWFRHRYVLVAKQLDEGLIEI